MLTLFNGQPVPHCPPSRGPFVVGVDAVRSDADLQVAEGLREQMRLLVALSEVPNTPFSGRFGCGRRWQ